jgi:hypothetical protein
MGPEGQHLLRQVQHRAPIPIRHGDQCSAALRRQRQLALAFLGAGQDQLQIGGLQPLQPQDLGTAHQRRVQLE